MRSAVQSLGVTIALNLIFLGAAWHLDLLDRPGLHVALAATNGVGALLNAFTLYRGLRRQGIFIPTAGWPALRIRILAANTVMAAVLWWMGGDLQGWLDAGTAARAWRCTLCVGAGGAVYFLALFALGTRFRDLAAHP